METAIDLAEKGGFEAVRLRDVAAHAEVALGTLYRRFRSKEELLVAALEFEVENLEKRFCARPPSGASEMERVMGFFDLVVRGLLRRQNLARALLKAVSSGDPELTQKMAAYHARIERMLAMSLRDEVPRDGNGKLADPNPSLREAQSAETLNQVWYALLMGWAGGVHGQAPMLEKMRASAELILRGSSQGP
ncbi:MAG: helix-turn-helix domain containing protein [Myxococcota bacterium]|nr:helix-turn-helix domain containing protein [Myxococcota bacterium]